MPKKVKRKKKVGEKNLPLYGLLSAVGEIAYIGLVVLFFWIGEFYNVGAHFVLSFMIFLLMFVFSAVVSGIIVLAYPAMLALRGERREALMLIGWTAFFLLVGILLGILAIIFII